jgi:hypothetical protein
MNEAKNIENLPKPNLNITDVNGMCFFVGMHNKLGMKPLDSKTMSGKMIDAIIGELPVFCTKTNLCEVDYFPKDKREIWEGNLMWSEKYQPTIDSIIVLLGAWVHKHFLLTNAKIIKLPHPASQFGNVNKEKYVKNAVDKIKAVLHS